MQSIDNLIDSQEWLIESYIEATKEFKRYIALQDQDFRADIEKARLKISKFKNFNFRIGNTGLKILIYLSFMFDG